MPKNLTIKIKAKDRPEAVRLVARLGLEFEVEEAELDGQRELFDKDNKPNQFLKPK